MNSLTSTFDNITVSIPGIEDGNYKDANTAVQTLINQKLTAFISGTLTTLVKDAINAGIKATVLKWGFPTSLSYILGFARSNFGTRVQGFLGRGN